MGGLSDPDLVVVGGGVLGLAIARHSLLHGVDHVVVLEKEHQLAMHQTGHNSGVVHAGIYYPPGSLKATLCGRGRALLRDYCIERAIPYEECGKVVVAVDDAERPRLDELHRRAVANGVPDITTVGPEGIRDIEPHARGTAGVHSPHTAIVDFGAVSRAFADDVAANGGEVCTESAVTALDGAGVGASVSVSDTSGTREIRAGRVVVCAGLHSDQAARMAGGRRNPMIVPFRGEYHRLRDDRRHLVRGLIYPVPDPRYPFLGIHLTRRIDHEVLVGPNAVLALAREGYRWRDVSVRDTARLLGYPGFWRMARSHWRTGLGEMRGSMSTKVFASEAARYVPELTEADLVRARSGVRAQAVASDGALVDDFVVERRGRISLLRNAPSPAATSSLAIAEHVWAEMVD